MYNSRWSFTHKPGPEVDTAVAAALTEIRRLDGFHVLADPIPLLPYSTNDEAARTALQLLGESRWLVESWSTGTGAAVALTRMGQRRRRVVEWDSAFPLAVARAAIVAVDATRAARRREWAGQCVRSLVMAALLLIGLAGLSLVCERTIGQFNPDRRTATLLLVPVVAVMGAMYLAELLKERRQKRRQKGRGSRGP